MNLYFSARSNSNNAKSGNTITSWSCVPDVHGGFFLARVKLLCWVLSVHFGNNFFLLTDFMPKLVPNNFIAEKWKEISKTPQFLVHSDALRYKDSHENRINNWQREWRKSFFYTRMTF